MTHLATVHLIILAFFALGTTMLMMVTLSNALRLRNVEITWKSGKLYGYPVFSSVFLLFSLALTTLVISQQMNTYLVPVMCYNWIGFNWFITSYLMSKRFVTDHGIVKNVNDPSQTVAWSRIMDYVELNEGNKQVFAFFYPDALSGEKSRNIRLELEVPSDKRPIFSQILRKKLGRRFSLGEFETTWIGQLK
ncbi:hypothetical protein QA596_11010 [Balneolales bacterium ANBcel1]|nr:hypothetical protein [Balneolales bacterium ANBcel1]